MELQKTTTNSAVLSEVVLTYSKYLILILKINVIGAFNNNSSFHCLRQPDIPVMNV